MTINVRERVSLEQQLATRLRTLKTKVDQACRERAVLIPQVTRLRLGAPEAEVLAYLRAKGIRV